MNQNNSSLENDESGVNGTGDFSSILGQSALFPDLDNFLTYQEHNDESPSAYGQETLDSGKNYFELPDIDVQIDGKKQSSENFMEFGNNSLETRQEQWASIALPMFSLRAVNDEKVIVQAMSLEPLIVGEYHAVDMGRKKIINISTTNNGVRQSAKFQQNVSDTTGNEITCFFNRPLDMGRKYVYNPNYGTQLAPYFSLSENFSNLIDNMPEDANQTPNPADGTFEREDSTNVWSKSNLHSNLKRKREDDADSDLSKIMNGSKAEFFMSRICDIARQYEMVSGVLPQGAKNTQEVEVVVVEACEDDQDRPRLPVENLEELANLEDYIKNNPQRTEWLISKLSSKTCDNYKTTVGHILNNSLMTTELRTKLNWAGQHKNGKPGLHSMYPQVTDVITGASHRAYGLLKYSDNDVHQIIQEKLKQPQTKKSAAK